jgi:hypothetical protein
MFSKLPPKIVKKKKKRKENAYGFVFPSTFPKRNCSHLGFPKFLFSEYEPQLSYQGSIFVTYLVNPTTSNLTLSR